MASVQGEGEAARGLQTHPHVRRHLRVRNQADGRIGRDETTAFESHERPRPTLDVLQESREEVAEVANMCRRGNGDVQSTVGAELLPRRVGFGG